jgi:hypothetical protein
MKAAGLLAEPFGERVRVGRRLERGPDRRGVHEPTAVLAAALQEVERRTHVLAYRAGRVGPRAGWVGDAREVKDGLRSGEQIADRRVARVDSDRFRSRRALRTAWPCDAYHRVPVCFQKLRGP